MRSHRNQKVVLPEWLWFFVALPLGLIALLLYRRREELAERLGSRLPERLQRPAGQPRYIEPDSIPLEIRRGEIRDELAGEEIGIDDEDPAGAKAQPVTSDMGEQVITFNYAVRDQPVETQATTESQANVEPGSETDDLKIIEGIGPAIATLLRTHGITTFRQLAAAPTTRLVEILTEARLNRLANPETWPEQAQLAADGKWNELEQLQGTLKGGRRAKNE